MPWYIVQTVAGKEEEAKKHLEKRLQQYGKSSEIEEIFIPQEPVYKNKKSEVKMVKLFGGYLFIKTNLTPELQVFIEKTPQILGFPGSRRNPAPIDPKSAEKIVGSLKARREKPRPKYSFEIGDRVEITSGPFQSFIGTVESLNENKEEVTVRVSVFGRETPVTLKVTEIKEVN